MSSLDILGCYIYYNEYTAKLGFNVIFDCSIIGGIEEESINRFFSELSDLVYLLTDQKVGLGVVSKELVSIKRYRIYKVDAIKGNDRLGQLRVVSDYNGNALNASIVLNLGDEFKNFGKVYGNPMKPPILLGSERSCINNSGAVGQYFIQNLITYTVEGRDFLRSLERLHDVRIDIFKDNKKVGELRLEEITGQDYTKELVSNFHCVTGWSVKNLRWGVYPLRSMLERVIRISSDCWIVVTAISGYSSVIPCSELGYVFLALTLGDEGLPLRHGAPVRLIAPKLYGWKSVKWVSRINILKHYIDGYWEALGYHERGLWACEERFKIRNPEMIKNNK